jgi:hypothetical protein
MGRHRVGELQRACLLAFAELSTNEKREARKMKKRVKRNEEERRENEADTTSSLLRGIPFVNPSLLSLFF